jgi:uncharacterized protein
MHQAPIVNPFNFETPADRWSFTDREKLLPRIKKAMELQRQRVLIYGRRRMGKTSLIKHVALLAKKPFAFVDLSTATDLKEVAKKLLGSVHVTDERILAKTLSLLRKCAKLLSLKADRFELSVELRAPAEETLEQVLNFLDEFAAVTDQCLVVCMDEFQDIRKLTGDRAEWMIRGIIQHHEHLSYIFSGSDHRLLNWMAEPNAAFYKQVETIQVGPIDPQLLAKWVDDRSHRGGLTQTNFGPEVVKLAGPCTGDIVRLAKQTFEFAAAQKPGNYVGDAFNTIALDYLAPEFGTMWYPLAPSQRSVLRAIANGQTPFATQTLAAYSLTVGSVGTAINTLYDKQFLIRVDDKLEFDSPFFKKWVAAHSNPDI